MSSMVEQSTQWESRNIERKNCFSKMRSVPKVLSMTSWTVQLALYQHSVLHSTDRLYSGSICYTSNLNPRVETHHWPLTWTWHSLNTYLIELNKYQFGCHYTAFILSSGYGTNRHSWYFVSWQLARQILLALCTIAWTGVVSVLFSQSRTGSSAWQTYCTA